MSSAAKKNWKYSVARKLLEEDLCSGKIPLDADAMKPQDVYLQRPEFAEFCEYKDFPRRLRELRKQISQKKGRAMMASAAISHDRRIYPKELVNVAGAVRWEGSEAERLLKLDMDAGRGQARSDGTAVALHRTT
jgi:hypothetical protein